LFFTSVLDAGGQLHTPATLTLGKEPPLPTEKKAGFISESAYTFLPREKPPLLAKNHIRECPSIHPM
jgi:hypothetical protein